MTITDENGRAIDADEAPKLNLGANADTNPTKAAKPRKAPRSTRTAAGAAPAPDAERRAPGRKSNAELAGKLRDPLTKLVGAGGLALAMGATAVRQSNEYRADQLAYDSAIVLNNASKVADELCAIAAEHPEVRRVLESLTQASGWTRTMTVAAALIVPIAANHGVMPRQWAPSFGAPMPPERPVKVAPVVPIRPDAASAVRDDVPGASGLSAEDRFGGEPMRDSMRSVHDVMPEPAASPDEAGVHETVNPL